MYSRGKYVVISHVTCEGVSLVKIFIPLIRHRTGNRVQFLGNFQSHKFYRQHINCHKPSKLTLYPPLCTKIKTPFSQPKQFLTPQ